MCAEATVALAKSHDTMIQDTLPTLPPARHGMHTQTHTHRMKALGRFVPNHKLKWLQKVPLKNTSPQCQCCHKGRQWLSSWFCCDTEDLSVHFSHWQGSGACWVVPGPRQHDAPWTERSPTSSDCWNMSSRAQPL